MFTLSFFQSIIELVRFIISQENVRSERLKILAARLANAKDTRQKQKLCEPRSTFFSTAFRALPLGFGRVVL